MKEQLIAAASLPPAATAPEAAGRRVNAFHVVGNLAIQRSLRTGSGNSPDELEADRMALTIAGGGNACACGGHGECPKCAARRRGAQAKEKPGAPQVSAERAAAAVAPLTGGSPLARSHIDFFEPRFGARFDHVRIHTGAEAEVAAARLNARAFTLGSQIVFGRDEYRPDSPDGRQLLAHELTHVVQQSDAAPRQVQRSALSGSITPAYAVALSDRALETEVSAVRQALVDPATPAAERIALQQNLAVLETEARNRNLVTRPVQDLDTRLQAFKQLVLTTARLRLASNRSNLAIWRTVVAGLPMSRSEAHTIQAAQIQQTVGHMGVGEWDVARCLAEPNPIRRQMYCGQLEGRYRACTGCHLSVAAGRLDSDATAFERAGWRSIAADVTGIRDTRPQPFQQAPSAAQMDRLNELTATYRRLISALGPEGYQVWPDSFVNWDSADLEAVRSGILSRIDQRQSDYLELMRMISAGERDYLEFEPILNDLLPLADAEVRQAVQAEIDAQHTRGIIEAIIVGIATIGALLLTIFPPTTALGVVALSALEVGLGTYGVIKGAEMYDQGYAASLATGANDVYSRDRQQSGGALMFFGFISIVTGPLAAYTGVVRGVGAAGRVMQAGATSALTPARALALGEETIFGAGELTSAGAGTVRQGRLLLSYEADGSIAATVDGQPDLLLVVRDGEAVMYERGADGALTAVQHAPVEPPPVAPRSAGATAEGMGDSFQYSYNPETPPPEVTYARPGAVSTSRPPVSSSAGGASRQSAEASFFDEPVLESRSPSDPDVLNLPDEGQASALAEPGPSSMSPRTVWEPPPGAPPRPPAGASRPVRLQWLRQRLQMHVDEAIERYATEGLTPAQEAAAAERPQMSSAFRGSRIDQFAKDSIMQDPELAEVLTAPDFFAEPDIVDSVLPDWFDMTTRRQWAAHLKTYSSRFTSSGHLLPTE